MNLLTLFSLSAFKGRGYSSNVFFTPHGNMHMPGMGWGGDTQVEYRKLLFISHPPGYRSIYLY